MDNLIDFLAQFTTERRYRLFRQVAAERTRYLTVCLEEIYQPQNASAVLRTCDCLGIQDVHILERRNRFRLNPEVELGSAQWLSIHKYHSVEDTVGLMIGNLREQGYRIVATSPHANDTSLDDFDLEKGKVALLFGTELNGLTPEALDLSEEYIRIPMRGFTESYNISVSAAITAYTLMAKLRHSGLEWRLNEQEQEDLVLKWLRKSIKNSHLLEKKYTFDKNKEPWQ
jgi:tRNA (guanosine-2'-O-)-methyltransferase